MGLANSSVTHAFRSKTSMSNVSFYNFDSRSKEVCCDFSTNLHLSRKLCALQDIVGKTPLPESFACLVHPQRSFGNPLRAVFSKIEILPGTAKFSSHLRGGFWDASSGFGRLGQKSCGYKSQEIGEINTKQARMLKNVENGSKMRYSLFRLNSLSLFCLETKWHNFDARSLIKLIRA